MQLNARLKCLKFVLQSFKFLRTLPSTEDLTDSQTAQP